MTQVCDSILLTHERTQVEDRLFELLKLLGTEYARLEIHSGNGARYTRTYTPRNAQSKT